MFNSAIIDVAIGIAFVYLFLSLVCSVVNEGIAALLALRSKNLVAGINSLFSESKLSDGNTFVQAIYEHGLVRGLFQDPPESEKWVTNKKYAVNDGVRSRDNAYVCTTAHTSGSSTEPGSEGEEWKTAWRPGILPLVLATAKKRFHVNLPSYIPARAFSSALVGVLLPSEDGSRQGLEQLRKKIAELPNSPTREALLNLAASTEKDIEEFQEKAEKWFDDGMDRVAGWYKRRTQKFLIAIGFAVAIILNVDTIKLAQDLWNNPIERQAAVDLAQKYVEQNKDGLKDNQALQDRARELAGLGKEMPFPFGWHLNQKQPAATVTDKAQPAQVEVSFTDELKAGSRAALTGFVILIGWVITALALSLGAPFWFDTLNKFMVVRATVKPREKSATEGSKDATSKS
jgi:hypothetical protein